MPNKSAAKKALRQANRLKEKNARMKMNVKTLYKRTLTAIKAGDKEKGKELATTFQQAADKAAKNHVISGNAAKRKKSSLMSALHKPAKKETA